MKIIQISAVTTADGDHEVYGLSNEGMLYRWDFGCKPKAKITASGGTIYRAPRSITGTDPELMQVVKQALQDSTKSVVFENGRSPGWVDMSEPLADIDRIIKHPLSS